MPKTRSFSRSAEKLLDWWSSNRASFPWRQTSDPYEVLVAELLLRKTRAAQVEKAYQQFIDRYPTPRHLAEASNAELVAILTPLGMEHQRAALFRRLGEEIMRRFHGTIPRSREMLLCLPGVGAYIADAMLCMAYGEDVPMVDTNVSRIFRRVFSLAFPLRGSRDASLIRKLAGKLIPKGKARGFNLALLDLGRKICLPRRPRCWICPLHEGCCYERENKIQGNACASLPTCAMQNRPPELRTRTHLYLNPAASTSISVQNQSFLASTAPSSFHQAR